MKLLSYPAQTPPIPEGGEGVAQRASSYIFHVYILAFLYISITQRLFQNWVPSPTLGVTLADVLIASLPFLFRLQTTDNLSHLTTTVTRYLCRV